MEILILYVVKMKVLVVFSAVVLVVSALTDQDLWHQFKKTHEKAYTPSEETYRFRVFQQNLRTIEEHNLRYDRGEVTYYMGITQFADMTLAEFHKILGYSRASKPETPQDAEVYQPSGLTAPASIDWRQKGAVMEVKAQACGDCWAFSSTGVLEGQNAIKKNKKVSLSEQNLIDCSKPYGNDGCDGGVMRNSYEYAKAYGVESEKDYPYLGGKDGNCHFDKSRSQVSVASYVVIPSGNENALKDAVATVGPISIAIDASWIGLYKGGVFQNDNCTNIADKLNHGVLAVGYGTEKGLDYWIVKNSWGPLFGEKGYIRMMRNAHNRCGVATDATYPKIR